MKRAHSIPFRLPAVLFLAAAGLLPAQGKVLAVPAGRAASEGRTALDLPFGYGPSRTQVILDRALLGGLGFQAVITGVGFRPDGYGSFSTKTVSLEAVLSTAASTPAAPAVDYAGNRGKDAVTVLPRTKVSLPWAWKPSAPPSGVRLWLSFTKTFAWKGGGLCLEMADFSNTKAPWKVDAASPAPYGLGRAVYAGSPCPSGKNTIASSPVPWPGAPVAWKTRLLDGSASSGSALLLLGAGLSRWGGFALPLDLDPLLGTKGCRLYTDVVTGLAASITAGRAEADMGVLPASPVLEGAALTAQWIVPGGSVPGGMGASNLARITLGRRPPFVTLYNYKSNSNPGSPRAEFLADAAPVLFLRYQ